MAQSISMSNVDTKALIVNIGQALFYAAIAVVAWRIAGRLADRAINEVGVEL